MAVLPAGSCEPAVPSLQTALLLLGLPPHQCRAPVTAAASPSLPACPGCWRVWVRAWKLCQVASFEWRCRRLRRWAPNTCLETGEATCTRMLKAAEMGGFRRWAGPVQAQWLRAECPPTAWGSTCASCSGATACSSPTVDFAIPPCCRPISITMARVWAALSGWEKARLLGSLLWMGAG